MAQKYTDAQIEKAELDSSASLFSAISNALQERKPRDDRQARWYELVNYGWRRKRLPFQGASDLDFKLADSMIEAVKPSYYAGIRGGDSLFRFTGLDTQSADAQDDAAYLLDDRLNYHSNFNAESLRWIHSTLQGGVGLNKIIWDPAKGENDFSVIEPEYWVVPSDTDNIQEADWFVHIIQLSVDQFMRDSRFKAECRTDDYVAKIKGSGNPNSVVRRQVKCRREGLTYSDDQETIILWEIWERSDTGAWMFSTKSPVLWAGQDEDEGDADDPTVRDLQLSPYKHEKLPVVPMKFEIRGNGIYDPRGIPELLCGYQVAGCKAWNEQQDSLTFSSRPCFTSATEIAGTSNITLTPGLIVPYPINKVDMGSVPIDFEKQINFVKELAEWRIQTPDFGITNESGGARTATEMNMRGQASQQGANVRVVLMRLALSEIGFMAWENLRQFDRSALDYIRDGELQTADAKVWDGKYRIEPGGAVDGSSKVQQMQQAQANIEVGAKFPFVALPEIVGDYYGLQGPSIRKRYMTDLGEKQQSEMERQATELADMLTVGFPIKRKSYDDDAAHLEAMILYNQACATGQKPTPSPEFAILQMQHGEQHAEGLKASKSPQAKQVLQAAAMMAQYLTGIVQQSQQGQPNLPMGQGGGPPANAQASPPSGPSAPPPDAKTGASVMQALASLFKAGAPVSLADVNAALAMAQLPPLDGSSPILHDPGSVMKPQGQPVAVPQRPPSPGAMP